MPYYKDFGTVGTALIKAGQIKVRAIHIYNENAAVRYFQLHDKATIPLSTEVPVFSFPVPAGTANNPGVLILDEKFWGWPSNQLQHQLGLGWAISTTEATYTAATAAEHGVGVFYQ